MLFDLGACGLILGLFMAKGKAKLRQDINVVWCGYIYSTSGYGSVTRSYILALIKAGVKVRAVDNYKSLINVAFGKRPVQFSCSLICYLS